MFDFVRTAFISALRAWLSQLSSAFCWRWSGWVRSRASGVGFTQKMVNSGLVQRRERREPTCMDGGRRTCHGAGRYLLMALHFFSIFIAAHSEGGLGIGIEGALGSTLLHALAFGWDLRLAFASFTSHLVCFGIAWEGFASRDCSPVMLCVIHTVPRTTSLPF